MSIVREFRAKRPKTVVLATVLSATLTLLAPAICTAAGVSFKAPRQCDSAAVIACGSLTIDELKSDYNASSDAKVIYAYAGITNQNVKDMGVMTQAGSVNKDGRVYIGKNAVASNVSVMSRAAAGHKANVSYKNISFYKSAPKEVLSGTSLDAFVVMQGSQFVFAIIASNDDPVTAPIPAAHTPATGKHTLPPVAAATNTPIVPTAALVDTGTSTWYVVMLAGSSVVLGTFWHHLYQRRRVNAHKA